MPKIKTCPRCFAGSDDLRDTCIQKFPLGCPDPVAISEEKVVVVKCGPCRKLLAIPIGNLMQRKMLNNLGTCVSDRCQAKLILPSGKSIPAVPPPISDAPPPLPPATEFPIVGEEGKPASDAATGK